MHTKLIKAPMRRSRRRYTEEFKKQAIAACFAARDIHGVGCLGQRPECQFVAALGD